MTLRRATLLIGLILAASIAGAFSLAPFRVHTALRRAALWKGGAYRVRVGTLAGWERDACAPGGACRCVALIHGLGDSAMTWDKVLLGRRGAAPVPAGTRLLALEMPGSEGSLPPASEAGYAIPAMAVTIQRSLQERCPEWTVVGNSLGGWISAWLAVRWPAGVKRLILVGAAGLDDPKSDLPAVARTLAEPTPATMRDFVKRAYHRHPPIPERAWPEILASIKGRPTAKIVAALRRADLLDRKASSIRAKTIVLWGESDRLVPRTIAEGYARRIPGARLETIPACGHLPQQECPAAVTGALYSEP